MRSRMVSKTTTTTTMSTTTYKLKRTYRKRIKLSFSWKCLLDLLFFFSCNTTKIKRSHTYTPTNWEIKGTIKSEQKWQQREKIENIFLLFWVHVFFSPFLSLSFINLLMGCTPFCRLVVKRWQKSNRNFKWLVANKFVMKIFCWENVFFFLLCIVCV